MNNNDGPPTGSGTQDDYESTVLDFLNQEMASVQQAHKPKQQSDEVDALVTDLLQQVITETDQPPNPDMPPYDEDELFVGLTPRSSDPATEVKDLPLHSDPSTAAEAKDVSLPDAESATENSEIVSEVSAYRPAENTVFGSGAVASSRKFPVKIAAAFAGLVLALGAAVYFFLDHSEKARESQALVAQTTKSEVPAEPVVRQPVSAPPAKQPVTATAAKQEIPAPIVKTNAAPVRKPDPSVTAKPPALPDAQPPSVNPSTAASKAEPAPAPPAHEEQIPAPPPVAVMPISMQSAPLIEKPAPQPIAETSPPVIPERKPALTPPVSSAAKEPPAPSPPVSNVAKEPPAPQPTPAAPTPRVSANLIPAVPVSQASPEFPALALRTRASGQVVMELQIDSQGKVVKARAVSGPVVFYNAAIAAAMKWRYKPASVNGVNVPSQSKVTMSFNLKE
jgi:protein TonB